MKNYQIPGVYSQIPLNIVANKYIGALPPDIGVYSSFFSFKKGLMLRYQENNKVNNTIYNIEDYLNAYNDPYIIHYAGIKPWTKNYKDMFLSEFLNYAKKTDFYEEILKNILYDQNKVEKGNIKRHRRKIKMSNKKNIL